MLPQVALTVPEVTVQSPMKRSAWGFDVAGVLVPPPHPAAATRNRSVAPRGSNRIHRSIARGRAAVMGRPSLLVDGGEGALQGVLLGIGLDRDGLGGRRSRGRCRGRLGL